MGTGFGNDWGKGCGWLLLIIGLLLMGVGIGIWEVFKWLYVHVDINVK